MKILTLAVLLFFFLHAPGHAKDYGVKKKAGDYEIDIRMDRNPVVVGDNRIELEVKSGGKTIKDARVLVNYYMPPMARMVPMNYRTNAAIKGEKYEARINIIMSGPWIIVIKVYHGEKVVTTKLNVDAQ